MKRNSNSEATFREPAVGASRQRARNELVLELRMTLKQSAEIDSLPALRVSSEQEWRLADLVNQQHSCELGWYHGKQISSLALR